MTFKHAKFDDSAVMRSLEKVAREKGWVESKPITKSASSELNFSPSSNLTENVLKLCAGLKQVGLERYALDIENKFVTFKQAATLYDTHGETGEDLVEAAHPKGSHKLEDMDSNHVVLTILDQHLKGIELANKKPTGKLSNARDILKAVKIVLADGSDQNTGLTQPVVNYIMSFFKNIDEHLSSTWDNLAGYNSDGAIAYNRLKANMIKHINAKTLNNATFAQINTMIDDAIKGFSSREITKLFYMGDGAEKTIFQLKGLKNYMNDTAIEDHKSLISSTPKADESVQQFITQINGHLGTLKSWTVTVNNDPENSPADKAEAMKWITERTTELTDLKNQLMEEKDPEEQKQKAPGFIGALAKSKFSKENAQFKKVWIG